MKWSSMRFGKYAGRAGKAGTFVAFALAVQSFGGVAAYAGVPAGGPLQESVAYSGFEALAAARQQQGDMPRLSNPSDAAMLNRLWDAQSIVGTPPYAVADVSKLESVLHVQGLVLGQYMKAARAAARQAAAAGDAGYQAEIARTEALVLTISPALLEGAADLIAKTVNLKRATEQQKQQLTLMHGMVDRVVVQIDQAVGALSRARFTAANQKVVADALARSAPRLAIQFTPAQRARVIQSTAKALPGTDPAAAKGLATLIASMSGTSCSTWCEVGEMAAHDGQVVAQIRPLGVMPVMQRQAPAAPVPQARQEPAAEAGKLLVRHREDGPKYGAEPTYSCSSMKEPTSGPVSADLARQYVICKLDSLTTGGGFLNLAKNVRVEIGSALSRWQPANYDADLKKHAYPIRGSLDHYMCAPLAGADGVVLSPRNCSIAHERNASGVCYRKGGFDDWDCSMDDAGAKAIGSQPPPGPLTSAQWADIQRAAPIGQLRNGMQAFQQGDLAGASKTFKAILDRNAVDPLANLWYGIVEVQLGNIWADSTFIGNVGEDTYPVVDELLALVAWHKGKLETAKHYLHACMDRQERQSAALCADMEKGIESGASAPAIKDWPKIAGLLQVTDALSASAAPQN